MRKVLLSLLAVFSFATVASAQWSEQLSAVAIAPSNDHVYYWYGIQGGRVGAGMTNDPFRYRGPQPFGTLSGLSLMAAGINSQDRVYYWWAEQSTGNMILTIGNSQQPVAYAPPRQITVPPGNFILQDAGIASDDRVYYYWRERESHRIYNTVGTSTNPTAHVNFRPLEGAIFMQTYDLRAVAIASDDHVYYWWENSNDGRIYVTAGTSVDPFAYRDVYPANQPN